jgi:tetratricopeptide (TPR) repeat protein
MKRILRSAMLLAAVIFAATAQTTSGQTPLQTGIAQFDAEKLDQAKTTLTPLAKSGDAEAMYYLGRIAIEQSEADEAVDWLEQAVKKNDRVSRYQQWLGAAYGTKLIGANPFTGMRLGPKAKGAMERAVELDPTNIEARANLIQFYLQAPAMMGGGVDKARQQVVAITAINPYQGRFQEAVVAENQKDTVGTERMLRNMIASFPDSSAPVTRLALYYSNHKRYDDAFAVLEDRLRRSPNDGPALYQLGRVGAVSGMKLDRAQAGLDQYLKMPHKRGTPSIAGAHWRRGMVFEAKGDKETARVEYETALRLEPKLAGAKASLDKLK